MKTIRFVLLLATTVMSLSTCVDSEDIISQWADPATDEKPEPTAVGFPTGLPVSKIIGTSGGTISDMDGIITVDIPDGALSKDTEITVQPIINFAPNGNDNAYRLGPEGTKFNKPITLTFKHRKEISAAMPALTGIAFQDIDGIWYSTGKFTWDNEQKTVRTETKHFSDWATFDVLQLVAPHDLKVNESGELQVLMLNLNAMERYDLTPLTRDNNNYQAVIKQWRANGQSAETLGPFGKIVPNDGGAVYTAPAVAPKSPQNPVNVSVTLKDLHYKDPHTRQIFKDLQLVAAVEILGEFKFKLEVKYKDEKVNPGVDSYITVEDQVTLKVHVKDLLVTISDIENSAATVIPAVSSSGKCKATWIPPFEGFAGPLTITEAKGLVFQIPGDNQKRFLNIAFETDAEFPLWKFQCPDGNPLLLGGGTGKGIFDLDFILKDTIQTIEKELYFATITPF
jgi:hypothetical protein